MKDKGWRGNGKERKREEVENGKERKREEVGNGKKEEREGKEGLRSQQ